jgi:hypothetical protein
MNEKRRRSRGLFVVPNNTIRRVITLAFVGRGLQAALRRSCSDPADVPQQQEARRDAAWPPGEEPMSEALPAPLGVGAQLPMAATPRAAGMPTPAPAPSGPGRETAVPIPMDLAASSRARRWEALCLRLRAEFLSAGLRSVDSASPDAPEARSGVARRATPNPPAARRAVVVGPAARKAGAARGPSSSVAPNRARQAAARCRDARVRRGPTFVAAAAIAQPSD